MQNLKADIEKCDFDKIDGSLSQVKEFKSNVRYVQFRILTEIIKQVAKVYHSLLTSGTTSSSFATKVFGGELNFDIIEEKSYIITFILDVSNWEDSDFSDNVKKKFPFLIKWKTLNFWVESWMNFLIISLWELYEISL